MFLTLFSFFISCANVVVVLESKGVAAVSVRIMEAITNQSGMDIKKKCKSTSNCSFFPSILELIYSFFLLLFQLEQQQMRRRDRARWRMDGWTPSLHCHNLAAGVSEESTVPGCNSQRWVSQPHNWFFTNLSWAIMAMW